MEKLPLQKPESSGAEVNDQRGHSAFSRFLVSRIGAARNKHRTITQLLDNH